MKERGILRRVAAILYHRRAGFSANGMGVWKVPEDKIAEFGPRMASFRGISHCYQRPTYEDWPYSVFTMAHGRSKEECDAILDAIAGEFQIEERATLYSSTEFKKIRLLYFTDDFTNWEREHGAGSSAPPAPMTASLTDTRSAEHYARALAYLPGGVNSPVRAMRSIGRDPIFVDRAEGAELIDVDHNRYVDWVCSWGPLIHGHAHPEIIAAVVEAAAKGTTFGAPTLAEVDLAEEVSRRVPSVQMLRMTSSGTEASMSAIRLARAATGRTKLLKFAGAYHGHVDGLLADAGSGLATQGIPASPGVPAEVAASTIVVPFNDPQALDEALALHEFAAILAEPYPANMGLVLPREGFLELLRDRADDNGALLIFDEVISGFRVAPGGVQGLMRRDPGPDDHGQGHRRRPARGGVWRPARAHAPDRPRRRRLPGGNAVGQPARRRGRPRLAGAAARRAALHAARGDDGGARGGPRGRGGRERLRRHPDRHRAGPADAVLQRRARDRLRRRQGMRPRRIRRLLPRPAGARRVRACVAVRGLVSVARAHARAPRADRRRRDRRVRRDRLVSAPESSSKVVARLRAAVRESGTPLASSLGDEPHEESERDHALVAAAGPRVAAQHEDVEIAVAAVDEGYRLHYGQMRALRIEDADLALLAGDRMYALGLARLAAIGDMTAIAELADVISLGAQAQAAGDESLADAAWEAGVAAIAHGASAPGEAAKTLARAQDPGAATALREAAQAARESS